MITEIKKMTSLGYAPAGAYRLEYVSGIDSLHDWAIVCPGKIDTWIVFLHGHGGHGDQLFTREDIRNAWLPEFMKMGVGMLCPNLRDNAWMSPAAVSDLHSLLDYLRKEYKAEHFIFFSGSMGGTGNLLYATLYPEDVAACVALGAATDLSSFYDWCMAKPDGSLQQELGLAIEQSYGYRPAENPELFDRHSTLKNCDKLTMPIFYAHGQADELIPVEQARLLARKMTVHKNFTYMEIPNGGHDSPLFTHAEIDYLRSLIQ